MKQFAIKCIILLAVALTSAVLITACTASKPLDCHSAGEDIAFPSLTGDVPLAGVRSSNYGIAPFPQPAGWEAAMCTMASYFDKSIPCGIWIVGVLSGSSDCRLGFPGESGQYAHIRFSEQDRHEAYLTHFDEKGIKVFLQVEPAGANVNTLIDLVLNRYKHHPCVIGFGVDVEWHREHERPGWGVPATDDMAFEWESRVKAHHEQYTLFLKHWDREWMPPSYRGNILFVSDSQQLGSFSSMKNEFVNYWARYFAPNGVGFQVGYGADRSWWQNLNTPPQAIGAALAEAINQPCSIFWVDFTLREVLPTDDEARSEGGP